MTTKKGSEKNDKLTGGTGNDTLYGFGGNDTLDGGAGNDEMIAGDGNDLIIGRNDGQDAIDGGKGNDTLSYAAQSALVSIDLSANGRGHTEKGVNYDAFRNIENFIGSQASDHFSGTNTLVGRVFGGGGDDDMAMGGTIMRGDDGFDQLHGISTTKDTFWLERGKGVDDVYTFTYGQDTIWLNHKDFAFGNMVGYDELIIQNDSPTAVGNRAQLIFLTSTDELYYDPDGTGSKDIEHVATFHSGIIPRVEDFDMI